MTQNAKKCIKQILFGLFRKLENMENLSNIRSGGAHWLRPMRMLAPGDLESVSAVLARPVVPNMVKEESHGHERTMG